MILERGVLIPSALLLALVQGLLVAQERKAPPGHRDRRASAETPGLKERKDRRVRSVPARLCVTRTAYSSAW